MIMPGKYSERTGLYLLEPYDPDQIPVVFIHGLMSVPHMWVPTIKAIQSDPEPHIKSRNHKESGEMNPVQNFRPNVNYWDVDNVLSQRFNARLS
jgi:hypothetical protein